MSLFICGAATGQDTPIEPSKEWSVEHGPGCRLPQYPIPGLRLYVDEVDGFQFKYPSALHTDGSSLQFESEMCVNFFHLGEGIRLEVSLPSSFQRPLWGEGTGVSVEKQSFNQLDWFNYEDARNSSAEYCTYWKHEQVCISGGDTSGEHRLSSNLIRTMHEMESTLVFAGVSDRLDSKIAAVKVGERFGSLTVRRVLTMGMKDRSTNSDEGYYGKIYFTGTLTLVGEIDNVGTMNSGSHWVFLPDSEKGPPIPFDLGKDLLDRLEFNNGSFVNDQMSRIPQSPQGPAVEPEITIVVRNVAAIFYPQGGESHVSADLVSMVARYQ